MPDTLVRSYGELVRADQGEDDEVFHFRMSDGSTDRVGDVIEQAGWTLSKFRSNPVALYGHDAKNLPIGAWKNVRVENNALLGTLKLLAAGKSDFVDQVRLRLREGVLRACSVGFRALKAEPLDPDKPWGGLRFLKSELLECSVVAVPANANAVALRSLESLSPELRNALLATSGNQRLASELRGLIAKSGLIPSGTTSMTLAERIQAAQDELIALLDKQAPLLEKVNKGETLDETEQTEFDELEIEKGKIQKSLDTMRATERALGQAAERRSGGGNGGGGNAQLPALAGNRAMIGFERGLIDKKARPADILIRLAVVHLRAFAQRKPLDVVQAEIYPDRTDVNAVVKAVTNPAQTTVAGWAAELVDTAILDFLDALLPISVYAQLRGMGIRFSFGRNGIIKIPRRNRPRNAPGDLRGAFVGEGQPIPVRRASFGSISLTPHKMGVISTFTREMANQSTPQIEGLIREGIVEDTAEAIDTALLDAVAGDAIRPAGLLNGVTPIAGSAATNLVDKITADLTAALAPFITANGADRLVWLINPANTLKLQFASTTVGVYPFRDQANAGNLAGFPLIQSTNVPTNELILMRYADFVSSTADTPEFDVSDVATIHEDDGSYPTDQAMRPGTSTVLPLVDPAGAVAKPARSLWQTASIGIRMLLDMDWAMRRASMVQVVTISW